MALLHRSNVYSRPHTQALSASDLVRKTCSVLAVALPVRPRHHLVSASRLLKQLCYNEESTKFRWLCEPTCILAVAIVDSKKGWGSLGPCPRGPLTCYVRACVHMCARAVKTICAWAMLNLELEMFLHVL